jgi:predicted ATPase/DNA-binding SARP family transcriptional activator
MIRPISRTCERLQIDTLGGLSIWLGKLPGAPGAEVERRLHFDARTATALLVYLACHARPLARETLAELFWPERSQEQALANLRACIHRLRRQLAPYLETTRQTVAFAPGVSIQVDARELETHLSAGRLLEAVALYQGDFLDGFYLEGSPTFEQWALLERERLRNLVISAYQQLITQAAAAGQPETAIRHAEQLLHLDPLHEPTHRQLMRLLAQTGRRAAALAQYAACCRVLEAELAAPPDDATTALYEQIRAGLDQEQAQHSSHHQTSARALSSAVGSPQHNLPPQPTPFIGRKAELAQVYDLLTNPDCRLLTLLGAGGIGKTRLALEAAAHLAGSFAHGVCFVSLAPIANSDFVLAAIAQSLGLQPVIGDLLAQVTAYLQQRALLLVLDNFEHLLDEAEMVAHLLHGAPLLKVLVTSRERLYLREEWLLSVTGLGMETELPSEAGQLFLHSAQRVRPGFTAHGQEEAIAAICQQVEGMPLALELAASWVRVMTCAEIARQMQANLDFLTTRMRDLPERHRSLRALFDRSWRLLSSAEQEVLRRVSVFRGGWMPEQAAELTGATLPLLLGLVDKSLVRASGHNRFDLHELVRQYAAEQLEANGEGDLVRERHYAAYLRHFRTGDSYLRGPEASTWLARMIAEQDNLRAALEWALDEGRYAHAAWLLVAAQFFWVLPGQWVEGGKWYAQLLPHRQALPADLRLAILINVHAFASRLEELQPVDHYTDEFIQLHTVCPDKLLQAVGCFFIGRFSADISQAAAVFERGIALVRAVGETPELGPEFCWFSDRNFWLVALLWQFAAWLIEQGEFTQATPLILEYQKNAQERGRRYVMANSLGALGRIAMLRGDLVQAHRLLEEAVTIAASFNYADGLGPSHPLLGLVTLYRGDTAEARRLLLESLLFSREIRDKDYLARVCGYLAELALWEGELDQAENWLDQSLAYDANPHRITIDQLERLWVAARLATGQRQFLRAATLFGMAEQVRCHTRYELVEPICSLVDTALATVGRALGAESFAEAFRIGQQLSLDEAFATILAGSDEQSRYTGPLQPV